MSNPEKLMRVEAERKEQRQLGHEAIIAEEAVDANLPAVKHEPFLL